MDIQNLLYLVPVAGVIALAYAFITTTWINKQEAGTDRMKKIADQIFKGAMAFLAAEYKILAIFVVAVAGVLAVTANADTSSPLVALSFVLGAVCSGLAGFFGMRVATRANVRDAGEILKTTTLNAAIRSEASATSDLPTFERAVTAMR